MYRVIHLSNSKNAVIPFTTDLKSFPFTIFEKFMFNLCNFTICNFFSEHMCHTNWGAPVLIKEPKFWSTHILNPLHAEGIIILLASPTAVNWWQKTIKFWKLLWLTYGESKIQLIQWNSTGCYNTEHKFKYIPLSILSFI